MKISVGERWEKYIEAIVQDGRYQSASEVVREALRLLEEREAQIASLRETIQSAIAEDKWVSAEDVAAELDEWVTEAKHQER